MSTTIERARELRKQIEAGAAYMSDEKALDYMELFPAWNGNGVEYKANLRLRYKGTLYKVLQGHTSQGDWTPDAAPSLYAKVLIPDPNVIPEWEQPDSTNGFNTGDRVTHNNKTWESLVDNNVWEPGVTGTESLWQEATE